MALWQRPNGPQTIAASPSVQAGLNVQGALAGLAPATLVLTGVAEAVVAHPQNPTIPFACLLSPNEGNEQVPFDLVASGYLQTTNTTNATIKLYSGTSLTVGSNTLLATSAAVAQNTAIAPWELHAHFVYDSVSGKLTGWYDGLLNNTLVVKAAISTVITGVKDSNNPVASFVLTGTSSAAAAGNPTTLVVRNFSAG